MSPSTIVSTTKKDSLQDKFAIFSNQEQERRKVCYNQEQKCTQEREDTMNDE